MDDIEPILELAGPIVAAIGALACIGLIAFAWWERRDQLRHHRELMKRNGERWRHG